jgi:hypothetical protein
MIDCVCWSKLVDMVFPFFARRTLCNQLLLFNPSQGIMPAGEAFRRKETEDQGISRIKNELASGFMPGKDLNEGAR